MTRILYPNRAQTSAQNYLAIKKVARTGSTFASSTRRVNWHLTKYAFLSRPLHHPGGQGNVYQTNNGEDVHGVFVRKPTVQGIEREKVENT